MPISAADRQVVEEALAELDEIDVEHHHHEQEQHRDRADIDDDQDHRQELGAEQHEQAGGVDEGEDQEQHRVDGIARADDHDRGGDGHGRKEVEEDGAENHDQPCVRPLVPRAGLLDICPAPVHPLIDTARPCAMFAASSRSQRSPLASSFALS